MWLEYKMDDSVLLYYEKTLQTAEKEERYLKNTLFQ